MLVLNKPSGIAVHGGSGLSFGVIEAMRVLYPHAKRLELVHRLDRETSGCLVIAKKASILKGLHDAMRGNEVEKTYLALLNGHLPEGETVVDVPLLKNIERSGERMVVVHNDGKQATTVFTPVRKYRDACLCEVKLLTGRTHQIRVHSAHIGHPIAGDDKYGGDEFNRSMKKYGLSRLFLHASRLDFVHPGTNEELSVVAPLDEQLQKVLKRLPE